MKASNCGSPFSRERFGSLSIWHDQPGGALTVPLSGEGALPAASLSATSLSFGSLPVGTTASRTVRLTSTGKFELAVKGISVLANPWFSATACPATVASGKWCDITVTFKAVAGAQSGILRIQTDAATSPHDVALDGYGTTAPALSFVPAPLDLGTQAVHSVGAPGTLHVQNSGTANLYVASVQVTGAHQREFRLEPGLDACSGKVMPPGSSCSVGVLFAPLATGLRRAELTFTGNVPPTTAQIIGTGDAAPVVVDWSQFRLTSDHAAFNLDESVIDTATVQSLAPLWTAATGGPVLSSPAVVDGAAYVGSTDGSVYAVDAGGGKVLWSVATGGPVRSSPAVSHGIVFVGSDDGSLYAIEAPTGALLWTAATGAAVSSSPLVDGPTLYAGSEDAALRAFDAASGKLLWSAKTGGPIASSPAFADGVVYVGSDDGSLYAFEAATGAPLWSSATGGAVRSTPAVADGLVYVGSAAGRLLAYETATGTLRWASSSIGPVLSSPAVAYGIVFIGTEGGDLLALDAGSGALLWAAKLGLPLRSSPAAANGIVYVGADDTAVHAFDAFTGDELWTARTADAVRSSPTVVNGAVYVGSADASLYAFHP